MSINLTSWNTGIDGMIKKQKDIDGKLSPSKLQMRYVADLARDIDKYAQLMDNASTMAHEGLIDFELAQKIMDTQVKNIERDMEYLKDYLGLNKKENNACSNES